MQHRSNSLVKVIKFLLIVQKEAQYTLNWTSSDFNFYLMIKYSDKILNFSSALDYHENSD